MRPIDEYYKFDKENQKSSCQIGDCGAVLGDLHLGNCEKHLKRKHSEEFKDYEEKKRKYNAENASKSGKKKKKLIQATLDDNFMKSVSVKINSQKVLEGCTELVTVNGRPFNIFNDSGLKKILDPVVKALPGKITINEENMKERVHEKALEIKEQIKKEIEDKLISVKMDSLKAQERCFVGVNIQYVDEKKLEIVVRTLGTIEVTDSQTGEFLKELVLNVLKNYNIKAEDVYTANTDNGKNMLKAVKLLIKISQEAASSLGSENFFCDLDFDEDCDEGKVRDEESDYEEQESNEYGRYNFEDEFETYASSSNWLTGLRCMAHTLQLAVEDSLKEEKEIIDEARNVVKQLRVPSMAGSILKNNLKRPVIDKSVRWMAKYLMLKRLLTFREFCRKLDFDLSEKKWDKVKELVKALEPAAKATKILQKEQLTPSDGFLAWFSCDTELQEIGTQIAQNISSNMSFREKDLFENEVITTALYLDPRFHATLQEKQIKIAKKHAIELWERLQIRKKQKDEKDDNKLEDNNKIGGAGTTDQAEKNANLSIVEKALRGKIVKKKTVKSQALTQLKDKLKVFSLDMVSHKNFNILKYWSEKKNQHPELYQIAMIVYSVPVTQVTVERLFSNVAYILNPLRNRLKGDLLEEILLVRMYLKSENRDPKKFEIKKKIKKITDDQDQGTSSETKRQENDAENDLESISDSEDDSFLLP